MSSSFRNVVRYWPPFKICSLSYSRNLQQKSCHFTNRALKIFFRTLQNLPQAPHCRLLRAIINVLPDRFPMIVMTWFNRYRLLRFQLAAGRRCPPRRHVHVVGVDDHQKLSVDVQRQVLRQFWPDTVCRRPVFTVGEDDVRLYALFNQRATARRLHEPPTAVNGQRAQPRRRTYVYHKQRLLRQPETCWRRMGKLYSLTSIIIQKNLPNHILLYSVVVFVV